MNCAELSKAIRQHARDLREAGDQINLADHADLLKVLAHIVEGMPVSRAFGSPGDWGYNTPVGRALAAPEEKLPEVKLPNFMGIAGGHE